MITFFFVIWKTLGILLTFLSVFIRELQIKIDLFVEQCRQLIKLFVRAKCFGNIVVC